MATFHNQMTIKTEEEIFLMRAHLIIHKNRVFTNSNDKHLQRLTLQVILYACINSCRIFCDRILIQLRCLFSDTKRRKVESASASGSKVSMKEVNS